MDVLPFPSMIKSSLEETEFPRTCKTVVEIDDALLGSLTLIVTVPPTDLGQFKFEYAAEFQFELSDANEAPSVVRAILLIVNVCPLIVKKENSERTKKIIFFISLIFGCRKIVKSMD